MYIAFIVTLVLLVGCIIAWFAAGFLAWRKEDGSKDSMWCLHDLTYGTGSMGDGVTCSKCGLNTYDEFNDHLWIFRKLGRVRDLTVSPRLKVTLATLPHATRQEVFDQAVEGMLKQGKRSYDRFTSTCMYRFDGLKCAAGFLIADEEYSQEFESCNWSALLAKGLVPSNHYELISSLQLVHDETRDVDFNSEEMLDKLKHLAIKYNVRWNPEFNLYKNLRKG